MKPQESGISESELWSELRKAGQEKRAANRESSASVLRNRGIQFDTKNGGAHLIVRKSGRTFDFWPGTGLWRERNQAARMGTFPVQQHKASVRGRGVMKLIEMLEASP